MKKTKWNCRNDARILIKRIRREDKESQDQEERNGVEWEWHVECPPLVMDIRTTSLVERHRPLCKASKLVFEGSESRNGGAYLEKASPRAVTSPNNL